MSRTAGDSGLDSGLHVPIIPGGSGSTVSSVIAELRRGPGSRLFHAVVRVEAGDHRC